MKILIAGYGSIGRVHAANAAAHGTVGVFDVNSDAIGDIEHRFVDPDRALAWGPDAVIVATPPETHLALVAKAAGAGLPVLIEKPVAASWPEILEYEERLRGTKCWVVCNMRFHPAIAAMTEHLDDIGAPMFARADYGHYLPNMRPGADYRTLYAARRAAGGGVVRDAIHEIDYLMSWFGPVAEVSCSAGTQSDLDIDVEDCAAITLRHETGMRSEIHLDYLRRRKRRGCEICGDAASLVWLSDGRAPEDCAVTLDHDNDNRETILTDPDLDGSVMYRTLMSEFIAAVQQHPHRLASLAEGIDAFAVALAALQSAESGRAVEPVRMAA